MTQKQNDIVIVMKYMNSLIPDIIPLRFCYDWNRIIPVIRKLKVDLEQRDMATGGLVKGLLLLEVGVVFKEIVKTINLINEQTTTEVK